MKGLRNFGGEVEPPNPPSFGTPLIWLRIKVKWRVFVNAVMNLELRKIAGEFVDQVKNC